MAEVEDDEESSCSDFGIVGLHTCGDLAFHSIKQFLSNPKVSFYLVLTFIQAKLLVNVACCYNIMTEGTCESCGFPLSRHVKKSNIKLGKIGKTLSCQTIWRWESDVDNASQILETLYYRVLMQHFLTTLGFDKEFVTGRLPKREFAKGIQKFQLNRLASLRKRCLVKDRSVS
jgi:hypothetical protein